MSDAPERIWAAQDRPFWSARITEGATEYARADLLATLAAEVEQLRKERDEARAANERDRTEIITAVNALTDAFARRDWLLRGGRGSYEWDDDRFRDEFRDAMEEFEPHVDRLRKIGADRTNCPETWSEVQAARAEASAAVKVPAGVEATIIRVVSDAMRSHASPDSGNPIGEGGLPRINWYSLREELTAALLSALTTEPAAPQEAEAVAKPIGFARAVDVDPKHRPFEGRTSFWCSERQNPYYSAPLYAHPPAQAVTEAQLLTEMAKHLNWELDWGSLDPSDETSECAWRVHARSGNRNDREWTLIGTGETPTAALAAAQEAGR